MAIRLHLQHERRRQYAFDGILAEQLYTAAYRIATQTLCTQQAMDIVEWRLRRDFETRSYHNCASPAAHDI